METKLSSVLRLVNAWEESGKLFFNRNSDDSMSIFIRDPRLWGGNPNVEHWQNANAVVAELDKIRVLRSDIQIDKQSGTLVIRVKKIYGRDENIGHQLLCPENAD